MIEDVEMRSDSKYGIKKYLQQTEYPDKKCEINNNNYHNLGKGMY
jgi:hypothetical protein